MAGAPADCLSVLRHQHPAVARWPSSAPYQSCLPHILLAMMTRHELDSTGLWMPPAAVRRGARATYSGLRRPRRTRHAPLTGQPFIQRLSSIGPRRLVPAVGFLGFALSDLTATTIKKNIILILIIESKSEVHPATGSVSYYRTKKMQL